VVVAIYPSHVVLAKMSKSNSRTFQELSNFSSSHTCFCGVPQLILFLVLFFSSCIPLYWRYSSSIWSRV